MKKNLTSEDKILKSSIIMMGLLTLLGTLMFVHLTKVHEIRLNEYFAASIGLYGFFTVIFSFLSLKFTKLRYAAVIFISLFIAITGTFQQMNISLLFIIPIFVGYCFLDRKKVYALTVLNIIFFNGSRIFKSFNIYYANTKVYILRNVLISNLVVSLFESIIFLGIAIPVLRQLVNQNTSLKKALAARNEATNDILQFCSTATSFHNKYLSIHIKGVRDITKVILDGLISGGVYIEPNYYKQIIFSVQFHDIGKIYIDSSILDKKGKLNPDEFNLIKEHPARGVELFSLLPKNVLDEKYIEITKNVIYQHHERLDGKGYPTGTKDMSFEAKIVAIADVVDALLSWRPYKPPLKWDSMVSILEAQKEGFSYECVKIVYQQKDKIMAISDANNKALQELLSLDIQDIQRQ